MEKMEETKEVTCLPCHKEVEVKLVSYGYGHIGVCPVCKKLAYNGE